MNLDTVVFNNMDAFEESGDASQDKTGKSFVHLRLQQRNGRKCLTLIEGLAEDLDLKKILKALKKTYSTNGAILKDEDGVENIIQMQGDQRKNVTEFFVKYKVCEKDELKIHGF